MTSSGKNGLNIRTNASPKWDRTRCPSHRLLFSFTFRKITFHFASDLLTTFEKFHYDICIAWKTSSSFASGTDLLNHYKVVSHRKFTNSHCSRIHNFVFLISIYLFDFIHLFFILCLVSYTLICKCTKTT